MCVRVCVCVFVRACVCVCACESGTIKSDNVPISYKSDHCSSNEENKADCSDKNKSSSSASKPIDALVETHSDLATSDLLPPAKQYASLNRVSQKAVSEYQKLTVQPPHPSECVTPSHITEIL